MVTPIQPRPNLFNVCNIEKWGRGPGNEARSLQGHSASYTTTCGMVDKVNFKTLPLAGVLEKIKDVRSMT